MPKSIGIIGGAGPMAGVLFHRKVVQIAQTTYGCQRDADFPLIVHLGYPFADTLGPAKHQNADLVKKQLSDCFQRFRSLHVDIAAIACNTLHAYLTEQMTQNIQFINIIHTAVHAINSLNLRKALVLCTSTSRSHQLYNHIIGEAVYPDATDQAHIDRIIDDVVRGSIDKNHTSFLVQCIERGIAQHAHVHAVILGCTELSELHDHYPIDPLAVFVIDPMILLAEEVCRCSFDIRKNRE